MALVHEPTFLFERYYSAGNFQLLYCVHNAHGNDAMETAYKL